MHKVGFIGLGIMGKPMVLNLIKAGYELHIFARNEQTLNEFHDQIKDLQPVPKIYRSPKDLASQCDVIITIVTATADVEEVLVGKHGIVQSAKPGTIVIDMSTISPSATQRMAQILKKKNIELIDAPVSGGEQGAINATLSIMVGANQDAFDKVKPILEKLGQRIIHIGAQGAGQIAKLCNQIIIGETIVAVSEALHLAKASGVNPEKVREALLGGFAGSKVLEIHGQRMLTSDYKPGFKASLHRKDMHLALEQAHQVGIDIPSAQYATKCLDRLVMKGHTDLDSSAMHLLIED